MLIKASAPSLKSQERNHHIDVIVSGPLAHLQAGTCHSPDSNRNLRLDVKFKLNLDSPNPSHFMDGEN